MVVLYEDLKERFVEVFLVGGIFEEAGGDAVEEGEVCCGIFLGGRFSILADMLDELFFGMDVQDRRTRVPRGMGPRRMKLVGQH